MALKRANTKGIVSTPGTRTTANILDTKTFNMPNRNYVNNKNGMNSPQYPGQQIGLTPAEAKAMYGTLPRSKGFTFSGATTTVKQVIDIPGDAKRLLGLASLNGAWGSVSLKINQLEAIEDTDTGFTKIGDNKEFYRVDLPLTGRDTISLIITGYAAYVNQPFIFFYI